MARCGGGAGRSSQEGAACWLRGAAGHLCSNRSANPYLPYPLKLSCESTYLQSIVANVTNPNPRGVLCNAGRLGVREQEREKLGGFYNSHCYFPSRLSGLVLA